MRVVQTVRIDHHGFRQCGVEQLVLLGDGHALVAARSGQGTRALEAVALPRFREVDCVG